MLYFFNFQNRNMVVFYGSQTGTAEEFAGRLAKDAVGYGLKGMVADPEECEMVGSEYSLISLTSILYCQSFDSLTNQTQ